MKTFVESQFGCCWLISMLDSRKTNSKTNHLQERFLRTVYHD